MGVSAKLAALHTVERDSLLEPHVGTRRCRRSGAQPDNAFNLQRRHRRSCHRASIINPAGDLRSSTSLLEDRHKRPLAALAPLSRFRRFLRTSRQILISLALLTIFSGESLANNRLAAGKRSTG